jgi:hypothetical protein
MPNRQPSIHISKANLRKILKEYGIKQSELDTLVNFILSTGSKYSLTSRKILVTNDRLQKQADKLLAAPIDNTMEFIKILSLVRRQFHHKGISPIKPGSKDYLTCKEVTANAERFCRDFDLPIQAGFKAYCETALSMMSNFFMAKMNNLHIAICTTYEAKLTIQNDQKPNQTLILYRLFQRNIIEKVGVPVNYDKMPEKYQYFVKARIICDELGVRYEDYIKAQFEGFEWRGAIPEPIQLIGEKAEQRLVKYAFANQLKLKTQTKKVDFSKILRHG